MSREAKDSYKAALKAEQAGKFSEALRLYKAAARADAGFREAFVNLGALYSRAKRPDLALGFFRRALEIRPDAAVYFNLGSECFKLDRLPDSERYLKAALKLEARLLRAHILLGYLYEKQKRHDKSALYFQNALRIDPTSRPAVLGLTVSLSDQEKYEAALTVVEKYRQRAAPDSSIDNLHAGLLLKLGRYDDSLSEYRKLINTDEGYTAFHEHLQQARQAHAAEYQAMFDGIDDKIRERTARLRKKVEQRKSRMDAARNRTAGKAPATNSDLPAAGPTESPDELKADLKDMVDLSFLHLFNGDTDKALRFLMQARKMKARES